MKKTFLLSIVILTIIQSSLRAQLNFQSDPVKLDRITNDELHKSLREFKLISFDIKGLNALCEGKKSNINFEIHIESYNWNITLEENELRSLNYQASENQNTPNSPFKDQITYKGYLNGNINQSVRLAISENQFEGYVMDGQEMVFIKSLSKFIKNYPSKNHFVVFNSNDIIEDPMIRACGVEEVKSVKNAIDKTQNVVSGRATTSCRVLEIATEADFEFFQISGSNVTTANNNILAVLNQVEGVYQTTFNIRFLVVFQSVWSVSSDPYNAVAPSPPGDASNVVSELATWWQANRSNINRDVVHFFSAKTGHRVRGSAKVIGGICDNIANSYSFTATNPSAATVNQVTTTAHEFGHLFGAFHPDSASDSCSPTPTIMCVVIGGVDNRAFQFSAFSQGEINTWINGHNACLTDVLNVNIGGTDLVCSTGQFTVIGLPANSSITSWSSANTSALTVTNSGVPTRQNNFDGSVNVTANGNYGNGGCTFTSTKTVWVGLPANVESIALGFDTNQPFYVCPNTTYQFNAFDFTNIPGTTYNWYTYNYHTIQSGQGTISTNIRTGNYVDGTYISVRAQNACGMSYWTDALLYQSFSCGGGSGFFSVYPNPADAYFEVEISESEYKSSEFSFYEIVVLDNNGEEKMRASTNDKLKRIDTSSLKSGQYFLNVLYKGEVLQRQIIIKR